jgi:hypothetical protein
MRISVCKLLSVATVTYKTIIDFLLTRISNLLENSQFEQLCMVMCQDGVESKRARKRKMLRR